MLARLKRYDDNYFVEKPLRGDAGAWPKAGPHNVLGNPAHTGRGVEAAIGAGHPRHAAKILDSFAANPRLEAQTALFITFDGAATEELA